MRLLTYNIRDGGRERASLIGEVLAAADPDVALLNEADDERVVEQLARQLSREYLWARGSGDKHIALLTRLPVAQWRVYNRRPITQAALVADLVVSGQAALQKMRDAGSTTPDSGPNPQSSGLAAQPSALTFRVIGVHLMPYFMLLAYEVARWRTLRALLRLARPPAGTPHVLCGDFNAALGSETADTRLFPARILMQLRLQANWQPRFALSQVARGGYLDCFRRLHPDEAGLTWMPQAPCARLDYIFADPLMAGRLTRCEVIASPQAARASDHFPLLAEFDL